MSTTRHLIHKYRASTIECPSYFPGKKHVPSSSSFTPNDDDKCNNAHDHHFFSFVAYGKWLHSEWSSILHLLHN
jgi:hypothetical protein